MSYLDIFERLYHYPDTACGKYEQGIVEGMTYMADKLIWAEQYYIDAIQATNKEFATKENWAERAADMYTIINDTIQDFCFKNSKIRQLWDKEAYSKNELNRRKLNDAYNYREPCNLYKNILEEQNK